MTTQVVLVGDSDISYWPSELYPTLDSVASPVASGHSGATLSETLQPLRDVLASSRQHHERIIVVACAGENDIGDGIYLDASVGALERFIEQVFAPMEDSQKISPNNANKHYLVFLGPKFEPWLNDDPASKKAYAKMSRSFQRCCQRSIYSQNINFIDCITMFCGDTSKVPGAALGGKAMAEYKYFLSDHLHLSSHGYKIWKDVVENCITENIL